MTDNNQPSKLVLEVKDAFKRFGKSVCVLSCATNEQRHASVATAVCNVSNDPPSLLICMEKNASMAALLNEGDQLAVNVLGADQTAVLDHIMAAKGADRFNRGEWNVSNSGIPILSGSQAILCCNVAEVKTFAAHNIYLAHIDDAITTEQVSGIIFLGGRFHNITSG